MSTEDTPTIVEAADYMSTLESASVNQNIKPFAEFLASIVKVAKTDSSR
jgi:hypothetical protein